MNSNHILFKTALAFAIVIGVNAQEKSKTFKENFNVSDGAVLKINTSHTDIEFETWNKDEVEITAVVELEGASDKEANDYFENMNFEIKGNSREIEITTGVENTWLFRHSTGHFDFPKTELLFEDLEFPEMPELPEIAVLPDMPPLPAMPPMPFPKFDYEAFEKDGEKYMQEWKKDFDKNFDEEYQEKMEAWGKRMEEKAKVWEERNKKRLEKMEERAEKRAEALEKRHEAMEERREVMEERRKGLFEKRDSLRFLYRDSISGVSPNIFYFSDSGRNKKFKVKKSIKIKMPKSVKLKMNVKHGEVKLAAAMKDVNASLRYASLLASTIEGSDTDISASYTPVVVKNWNYGTLKTDYSENVKLTEVGVLNLNSVSSDVVIDRLNKKGLLNSNLGALKINSVADGFSTMDITIKNGELYCKMPNSAFLVEVEESRSDLTYPKGLIMEKSPRSGNSVHSGYHLNAKGPKSIKINSRFSEVVLKD